MELQGLSHLEHLGIGSCGITDACLAALGSLKQLEQLSIRKTRMTPQGIDKLRADLPNTKVHFVQ